MKKIVLVFCLVFCLVLTACVPTSTDTTSGDVSSATNTDTTYGLNETVVLENLTFTATELQESKGSDFFLPEAGNVFVGVRFTIENTSDQEQSVSSLLLFEGYVDDVKCDYSFSAACVFDDGTLDGSIAPGKKLMGWYAVEIPENWGQLELQVQSSWLSSNDATFLFQK